MDQTPGKSELKDSMTPVRMKMLSKDGVQCVKDHGVLYTLMYLPRRMERKQAVLLYMPDCVHEPEGIEELMPWSDKMKKLCAIDTKATIEDKDGNPKISR